MRTSIEIRALSQPNDCGSKNGSKSYTRAISEKRIYKFVLIRLIRLLQKVQTDQD